MRNSKNRVEKIPPPQKKAADTYFFDCNGAPFWHSNCTKLADTYFFNCNGAPFWHSNCKKSSPNCNGAPFWHSNCTKQCLTIHFVTLVTFPQHLPENGGRAPPPPPLLWWKTSYQSSFLLRIEFKGGHISLAHAIR